MSNNRQDDVQSLRRLYQTATNDAERTAIQHSLHKINSETKETRSMREALVKATREGNKAELADIHDYIKSKDRYNNDR